MSIRTCSFVAPNGEACGRPHYGRGLCNGHIQQQRLGKALTPLRLKMKGAPLTERFWAKVGPATETGCLPWLASLIQPAGLGQFSGSTANRFAWELANGPIPEGLNLANQCGNKTCVNHEHWKPVTVRQLVAISAGAHTTSQYLGVSFNTQMWQWKGAAVVHGKRIFLGYFDDELEAAQRVNDFLEARGEKPPNDLSLGYTPDDRKYGSLRAMSLTNKEEL